MKNEMLLQKSTKEVKIDPPTEIEMVKKESKDLFIYKMKNANLCNYRSESMNFEKVLTNPFNSLNQLNQLNQINQFHNCNIFN